MIKLLPTVFISSAFTSSVIALLVALPIPAVRSEQVIPKNTRIVTNIKQVQDKSIRILFVNRTGSTLTSLQVAPAKTRRWNSNILNKDLLDGQERSIKVGDGKSECRRDLKAVFSNGTAIEDFDVDVCKNDIYTFTVSGLW